MKKRFLSAGLAVVMAASLTACGGSDSASTTAAAAGESKAEGESAAAGESSAAADGAVFKIGGIGPVTGGAAVYGLAVCLQYFKRLGHAGSGRNYYLRSMYRSC